MPRLRVAAERPRLSATGAFARRDKTIRLDYGYRIDILVEERVILELKTVERLIPVHEAQLLTYLKLSGVPTGLLLNFNSPVLRDGIRRMVL
jgi:GxxExxY protein